MVPFILTEVMMTRGDRMKRTYKSDDGKLDGKKRLFRQFVEKIFYFGGLLRFY